MNPILDNMMWHCLSGFHKKHSSGTDSIRRYAQGFSPIIGFADQTNPDFAALSAFCNPGEHFYCEGWNGVVPAGWQIDAESTMYRMVWAENCPDAMDETRLVALNASHTKAALELAQLTKPGPFGLRTIELGAYFGVFEGERLIAMAGERMHAGSYHEISGVCTHPEFQGRGLARQLMNKLIRLQLQKNETPFLQVMRDNVSARALYEQLGFNIYRELVVRVIEKL